MITQRDIQVLLTLARYFVLDRPQLQRLCFPSDTTGRVTRRRLQQLFRHELINRQRVTVDHPFRPPPGSIYFLATRGREFLAEHFGEERYRLVPVQTPRPDHVLHWIAVSETHIALDEAIDRQETVRLEEWINEWDVVNKDEADPDKRFRLYMLLRDNPRLICAPDAAFLLLSPISNAGASLFPSPFVLWVSTFAQRTSTSGKSFAHGVSVAGPSCGSGRPIPTDRYSFCSCGRVPPPAVATITATAHST